ncbi:MAG TPA: hypothetical protein VMF52_07975 [Steroidobacteraceae bacterium]|nr:hypothetical protein [Steroidobacteraceae bacterium]
MRPFARTVCCFLTLLPLAACRDDKPATDLGTLQIDAGRLELLIDKSTQGLDLVPAKAPDTRDADAARRLEIDWSLRDAALKVLVMRNRLLQDDRITEKDARATHWPAWILQPPESSLSPAELAARLEWLNGEVQELTAHGCKIGVDKTGNALYCSVE